MFTVSKPAQVLIKGEQIEKYNRKRLDRQQKQCV